MTVSSVRDGWAAEYARKGIPSSYRTEPSRPLVEFVSWLSETAWIDGGTAIDLGCGLGRNAYYLAGRGFLVTALDVVEQNIAAVNSHAAANGLSVWAFVQKVSDRWPVEPNSQNVAIDIFCYKHLISKAERQAYRNELAAALQQNGYFFISLASVDDGFYGPLLAHSTHPEENLILDPHSNIHSILYTKESLVAEFSDLFKLVDIQETYSKSPMYGQEYNRTVINAKFQVKK